MRATQDVRFRVIADYVPDGTVKTVSMIKEADGTADCLAADVSVTKQVEMMVSKTVEIFGRICGAFNNAGIEGRMGLSHRRSK